MIEHHSPGDWRIAIDLWRKGKGSQRLESLRAFSCSGPIFLCVDLEAPIGCDDGIVLGETAFEALLLDGAIADCCVGGEIAVSGVPSLHRGAGFAGGGDVFSSGFLERLLGGVDLFGGVAVNGEESASALDGAFVTLGFVLGDSHSDPGSNETA